MSDHRSILIVDDEASQRAVLAGYLRKKRHKVLEAGSVGEAIPLVQKNSLEILLTDFKMPDRSGYELLKEVRTLSPETTVVIMTAFGTIEDAVEAMRAYDYLTKPIELDELDMLIQRIAERQRLLSENKLLKEQLAERFSFEGIISQSGAMESVLSAAARVASSSASVLLRGESGTGKELVARAIHFGSSRKEKPFLAGNCAALNENLLESELFGHEKGAFTGAEKLRRGRFERAHGGTIFLDEIGDVPLSTQVKLLRVLQEHQFERVGSTEQIDVDVRVIAATNRPLEEMILSGSFREDLYYRLNVVMIEIPPLRPRREDIAPTLEHVLAHYAREHSREALAFSKEAWNLLLRFDYPGNVREVQNTVQRAVIFAGNEIITTEELPHAIRGAKQEIEILRSNTPTNLPTQVERVEKDLIFEALRIANGNQSKAAKELGISERNLRYRLQKWGVKQILTPRRRGDTKLML